MLRIYLLGLALAMLAGCQGQTPCSNGKLGNQDYLSTVTCPTEFNFLEGKPLTEKFGDAKSLKVVYQLSNKRIYYTNGKRYPFHFDFCTQVLGTSPDLEKFNRENYSENSFREFILCNINYYPSSHVYALELMPEDKLPAPFARELFQKISATTYFKDSLKLLVTTPSMQTKYAGLPMVEANEIYKGRSFIALNKGVCFGTIRKIKHEEVESQIFDKHDIIILDGLPDQLPVVSGVITVPFQTPLCHISLLCQNRGTPNMTYTKAWSDAALGKLEGKLVRMEIRSDTFLIRIASIQEAEKAWKATANRPLIKLSIDRNIRELTRMDKLSWKNVSSVGGKAANFAELTKIRINKVPLPLPEGSFAIPFYFYLRHVELNHIQPMIDSLLSDETSLADPRKMKVALKKIRDRIKDSPLDASLLNAIRTMIQKNELSYVNYRFRSSTNAEDVKGFNGAGLYDSKTGSVNGNDKPIDKAVKAVWASLWDDRAFIERSFFNIDQHTVAMGILVHRAFGEEISNGVAVTRHLYRKNYPAYTINVQKGEVSVVTPPENVSADEVILALGEVTGSREVDVEYIGKSNLTSEPVLSQAQYNELAAYLTAIKQHYFYKVEKGSRDVLAYWNFAMDVEFKVDAFTGRIYIKQARTL